MSVAHGLWLTANGPTDRTGLHGGDTGGTLAVTGVAPARPCADHYTREEAWLVAFERGAIRASNGGHPVPGGGRRRRHGRRRRRSVHELDGDVLLARWIGRVMLVSAHGSM